MFQKDDVICHLFSETEKYKNTKIQKKKKRTRKKINKKERKKEKAPPDLKAPEGE